jgi:hypothetical protein
VPPLRGCAPLRHSFPPLLRWATLCRPSGVSPCFVIRFPPLPRWATFCRPSGAVPCFVIRFPPLPRWATFCRPSGAAPCFVIRFPPLPRRANLCRPSGAAPCFVIRSRRFRGGLRCAAPPGLRSISTFAPTASAVGYVLSPLRGCALFRHSFPPLPRWATFCRPSGAALYFDIRSHRFRGGLRSVAPPGLRSISTFVPTASAVGYVVSPFGAALHFDIRFPPLPRWATLCRPSGAALHFDIRFPPLPRGATLCRPSGAALHFDIRSHRFRGGLRCVAPPGLRPVSTFVPTASAMG